MKRAVTLCTGETAACIIPHIISELRTPCPCRPSDGLFLTGETHDGRPVNITLKKGILEVEGIDQEELDEIVRRRCPIRTESPANLPP